MPNDEPTTYQMTILRALQSKLVYGGTVNPDTVLTSRIRNRVARKSRRLNRIRGGN